MRNTAAPIALAIIVALVAASAAAAGNGKNPPTTTTTTSGKDSGTHHGAFGPGPTPANGHWRTLPHYGIYVHLSIGQNPSDGGTVPFVLTIHKLANTAPTPFIEAGLGTSFGGWPKITASLHDLNASLNFVDLNRTWIGLGHLRGGEVLRVIRGKVDVLDRKKTIDGRDATQFCARAEVNLTPDPTQKQFPIYSNRACAQYAVS